MILNKSAHERGFGHGSIYKSQIVDLKNVRGDKGSGGAPEVHFGLGPDVREGDAKRDTLDDDGLPFLGTKLKSGDAICAYIDRIAGKTRVEKYKGDEVAYVEEVRLIGEFGLEVGARFSLLLTPLSSLQAPTPTPPKLRSSTSSSASPVPPSSATNSRLVTVKRESARKSTPPSTCPSPNRACNPTSSSILTPSPLA